jgi:hypothetical protein
MLVIAKIFIRLASAEDGAGLLEREEHFAGAGRADPVGSERGEDHGESVLDGAGVLLGREDVGGEGGCGVDGGPTGAVELLVVETVGAGTVSGRLATASGGHGVSAEGELGMGPRVHWLPFSAGFLSVRQRQREKPLFK